MFKFIIIIAVLYLGYTQLTKEPQKSDSKEAEAVESHEDSTENSTVKTRIEEYKEVGRKVTSNTNAFKKELNSYLSKFRSVNTRADQSRLHSEFTGAVSSFFQRTFQYRNYPEMTASETKLFNKLKTHMNVKAEEIDRLSHQVYVASASAKSRAYNRECGKMS